MKKLSVLLMAFALLFAFSVNHLAEAQTEKGAEDPPDTALRDLRRDRYFEMGANLGWPAVINGAVGYWFGPVGLRLSGMYWDGENQDGINAVQCDIGYKLSDNVNTLHSVAVAGGTSRESLRGEWSYLGAAYCLNHKWFFLEIGLAKIVEIRREVYPIGSFQAIFQIGYMHRFLPKSEQNL